MIDKGGVYRIPKWHFVVLAIPTLAAIGLGGALVGMGQQMSLIPHGSQIDTPTNLAYGSAGCFADCQEGRCDAGFKCDNSIWNGWGMGVCTADFCNLGLGCGSVCDISVGAEQCAPGLICMGNRCWGDVCGAIPAACGLECGTGMGGSYADPSKCPQGFECVGAIVGTSTGLLGTDWYCWSQDMCLPTDRGGTCGDVCGPDAPCGADLFCVPGEKGGDSTCWHPDCPAVGEDSGDNPPVQNVNPNPNVNLPTEVVTELPCTCEGVNLVCPGGPTLYNVSQCGGSDTCICTIDKTLVCPDGTYAPFNPQCLGGSDKCANSTCGDGICSAACGEDINTCAADCHI